MKPTFAVAAWKRCMTTYPSHLASLLSRRWFRRGDQCSERRTGAARIILWPRSLKRQSCTGELRKGVRVTREENSLRTKTGALKPANAMVTKWRPGEGAGFRAGEG